MLGTLLAALLAASPAATSKARPTAWTEPEAATAKASKPEVRLGEPFTVTVEVKHAPGERWTLDPKQALTPFALEGQTEAVRKEGAFEVSQLALRLALFKLGPEALPDLKLVATDSKGVTHPFSLPGPEVKGVAPDLAKDHDRRDIRPPVAVRVRSLRLVWLALGLLAALGLALAGLRYWRRRPRRGGRAAILPIRPPHELALEALTQLESEGLPAQGRFKEFHLRLSQSLRSYLAARFEIQALDMTSSELLERLERLPTDGLRLADLSWVCGQGDLAKFAKAQPSLDDCKQALGLVRQLVQRTRRVPEEAPGADRAAARGGLR